MVVGCSFPLPNQHTKGMPKVPAASGDSQVINSHRVAKLTSTKDCQCANVDNVTRTIAPNVDHANISANV